jgi:adenylate cyclase
MRKALSLLLFMAALATGAVQNCRAQADPEPVDYYAYRDSLVKEISNVPAANQKAASVYRLIIAAYEKENGLARNYSSQLFPLTQAINTKAAWADYYGAKGRCLFREDYDKGRLEFEKAYTLYRQLNDESGQANMLTFIGICYNRTGHVDKAIKYFKEALDLALHLKDSLLLNESYQNLGYVSEKLNDLDKALYYNKEALKWSTGFLDSVGAINNIAIENMDFLGNLAEAYRWMIPFRSRVAHMAPSVVTAEYWLYLGKLYEKMQRRDSALYAYNEGIRTAYSCNDYQRLAMGYYSKARVMSSYHPGMSAAERQWGPASIVIANLDSALFFARASRSQEEFIPIFTLYASAFDKQRNAVKANQYKDSIIYYTGLIFSNRTAQEVHSQIAGLQGKVKDQEIQLLRKEGELQSSRLAQQQLRQRIYIGGMLLLLLLSAALVNRLLYVRKTRARIQKERDRSDHLLLNILPAEVAGELKELGYSEAKYIDSVTVLFTDFKEFTQASEKLSATELVEEINYYFKAFDVLVARYNVEKIKTIGDSYMAAGGLPSPYPGSVHNTVMLALEMQAFLQRSSMERKQRNRPCFEMRIGVHTGPVVAGIVGTKKFQYDIWGDTVNTASRMESSGVPGKVNISESTYLAIKDDPDFSFESRGKVPARHKGEVEMYFVRLRTAPVIVPDVKLK